MEGLCEVKPLGHPTDRLEWPNLLVDREGGPFLSDCHRELAHRAKTSTSSPPGLKEQEGQRRWRFFFYYCYFLNTNYFQPEGRGMRAFGGLRPPAPSQPRKCLAAGGRLSSLLSK